VSGCLSEAACLHEAASLTVSGCLIVAACLTVAVSLTVAYYSSPNTSQLYQLINPNASYKDLVNT
jgi:hypothetical protein